MNKLQASSRNSLLKASGPESLNFPVKQFVLFFYFLPGKIMLLIAALLIPAFISAQIVDSVEIIQLKHSPRKATIYSAVLPGAGQVYNQKYWKVPVIYAGFGTIYFISRENSREYRKFLDAYRHKVNDLPDPPVNDYVDRYTVDQLLSGKNYYLRNLEVGYIVAGFFYILNILDASVDGHLFDYDVSENLSFSIEPALFNDPYRAKPVTGLSMRFRF